MKVRQIVVGVAAVVVALPIAAMFGLWLVLASKGSDFIVRVTDTSPHRFDARVLLAATDADMVGTSYADGKLFPMGAHDAVSRVDVNSSRVQTSDATISNSVVSWPGTIELSPDAKYAYVVESRGPAPVGVERVANVHKDLAVGRLLTTIEIGEGVPRIVRKDDIAIDPASVSVAPNGEWLAIASRDANYPITFVILDHGVPVEVRHPQVTLPNVPPPSKEAVDVESFDGVIYARIAPNGHTLALNIKTTHFILGDVTFDDSGKPAGIRLGDTTQPAKCMSEGRWSLDGRFYIVSDTQWGPRPADTFVAGEGQLISIAVDGLNAKVVSVAKVSLSPEGMEMSRDGSLFVAVNMERTYAPGAFGFNWVPRSKQSSLSLVSFDTKTGALQTVDGPVAFDAVLPEDAVFDRDANMLAVAVFNDRVAQPRDGWIELFSIDRSAGSPRIVPTGKRIQLPRGVHDLAVAY